MSYTKYFRISTFVRLYGYRLANDRGDHNSWSLGRKYLLGDMPTMKDEEAAGLRDILLSYGVKVKIGG
jgi:hypothetical protein